MNENKEENAACIGCGYYLNHELKKEEWEVAKTTEDNCPNCEDNNWAIKETNNEQNTN